MTEKKILTRDNTPTDELQRTVQKVINNVKLSFTEFYYLDFDVDEETGMIDKQNLVEHYTKDQTIRNLKAQKSAYHIAKGAASPMEIINFRNKYDIAASVLSMILGFSKNTISNIENEGVTSLPSGRFIKVCINNNDLISQYIGTCSFLETKNKKELLEKFA